MYTLIIFGKGNFSLTMVDDAIEYLGNGVLTKRWSDGFFKVTFLSSKFTQ